MVSYIDVPAMQAWLRRRGVATVIAELAEFIRADFLRWPEIEKSARLASHSAGGVIELMPAADRDFFGFKYVNGHPGNARQGKLTVMAFGVLADVATGYPLLLSEMTLATALRTAATSALAASLLARPDSRRLALIGNGAQSEFQALAFQRMLGIDSFSLYDVDPSASARLQRNLLQLTGLPCQLATSAAEAVAGADIVTTMTADKRRAAVLTDELVTPGMHLNALGGDCPGKTELDARILQRARVVVEYEPQTRGEGEIQQLTADFPVIELWQLLSGAVVGRQHEQQITLFDSVGFALEDFSTLRYLYHHAQSEGFAIELSLVPELDDCRDLFSLVAPL
jgi:ornithine cyclodeaminase